MVRWIVNWIRQYCILCFSFYFTCKLNIQLDNLLFLSKKWYQFININVIKIQTITHSNCICGISRYSRCHCLVILSNNRNYFLSVFLYVNQQHTGGILNALKSKLSVHRVCGKESRDLPGVERGRRCRWRNQRNRRHDHWSWTNSIEWGEKKVLMIKEKTLIYHQIH